MNVFERAARANFSETAYLLANPDVADAVRKGSTRPWDHFTEFGANEKRLQFSGPFLAERATYLRKKYERFKHCLLEDEATHVRFLEREGAFPVALSSAHFEVGDYSVESANDGYGPFIDAIKSNQDKAFLDPGCGVRREVFENCLYLEVYPSLTADVIVAPGSRYPIASDAFDGVGCFAVLEHVTEPWTVVPEIHRMTKKGGQCYISWPFLQPIHGYPSHYYNATRDGLKALFSKYFEIVTCRTEPCEGPDYTIAWILGSFLQRLPEAHRAQLRDMTVGELVAQLPGGAFWTDVLRDLPDAAVSEFACGNSLIATKR